MPDLPTPDPAAIERGVQRLTAALQDSALPPAELAALTAILGTLHSAAEILEAVTRQQVGGIDFPSAAGILASVMDARARQLARLGDAR